MLSVDQLRNFVPFKELDEKYLKEAIKCISVNRYSKGQMLFKRGRRVSSKYYILDGHVDLIDSSYHAVSVKGGSDAASTSLNVEVPTRSSAIIKSESATILSIEEESLDRVISWSESVSTKSTSVEHIAGNTQNFEVEEIVDEGGDWMSSLLQSPLFSKIPLSQVQELFLCFEEVEVKKGQVIVKEGEKGDYFYVLATGTAKVTNKSDSVNIELEAGRYFGEEALLGNTVRNASIVMVTDGTIKRLTSANFKNLLQSPVLQYIEDSVLEEMGKPYKVIDVKMPMEYRANHIPGSINVPLSRLRSALPDLGDQSVYVVPDDAGSRADIAAHLLCQAGFEAFILRRSAVQN